MVISNFFNLTCKTCDEFIKPVLLQQFIKEVKNSSALIDSQLHEDVFGRWNWPAARFFPFGSLVCLLSHLSDLCKELNDATMKRCENFWLQFILRQINYTKTHFHKPTVRLFLLPQVNSVLVSGGLVSLRPVSPPLAQSIKQPLVSRWKDLINRPANQFTDL